jgi:hypothetical protein
VPIKKGLKLITMVETYKGGIGLIGVGKGIFAY